MITALQTETLAKEYQIDTFSVIREYCQLLFLNYLYQEKEADKIYFKGGTAIHFLFDSARFSEDLDFSTSYSQKEISKIIKKVETRLQRELEAVKILILYSGKRGIRFRLCCRLPSRKYPLAIRLDFNLGEKPGQPQVSPLTTKFPLVFSPLISHLSAEEILAEKIRALLIRGKGRDVYDLWFLLQKGTEIKQNLLNRKLKTVKRKFEQRLLIEKIKNYPIKSLERDLGQFLPHSQRKITKILKEKLLETLVPPKS